MVAHYPGPYEVEIDYVVTVGGLTLPHSLTVSCIATGSPGAGAPVSTIQLANRAGTTQTLQSSVDGLWNIVRLGLNSTTAGASGFTLWRYAPNSFDRTFIAAGNVTNALGATPTASNAASQAKLIFRTAGGSTMQINVMEHSSAGQSSSVLIPAGTGAWWSVLAQYVLSTSGWMIGRDDTFPVAAKTIALGQNEATFKKRFRQT